MVNYNRLKKENEKLNEKTLSEMYEWQSELDKIAADANRTSEIAKYSSMIIDDLEKKYSIKFWIVFLIFSKKWLTICRTFANVFPCSYCLFFVQ